MISIRQQNYGLNVALYNEFTLEDFKTLETAILECLQRVHRPDFFLDLSLLCDYTIEFLKIGSLKRTFSQIRPGNVINTGTNGGLYAANKGIVEFGGGTIVNKDQGTAVDPVDRKAHV